MANLDLSRHRVKNAAKQVDAPQVYKFRKTVKQTVSGMKTLIGQLSLGSTAKIREERRAARKRKLAAISAIFVALFVVGVFMWLLS